MKNPRTLAEIKAHPDVIEFSDESRDGDGYWVYLRPGLKSPATECHTVHEWTARELLADFAARETCDCADCRRDLISPYRAEAIAMMAKGYVYAVFIPGAPNPAPLYARSPDAAGALIRDSGTPPGSFTVRLDSLQSPV